MHVNKLEIAHIFAGSHIRTCGMYDVGFYGLNCKIPNTDYHAWAFKRPSGSSLNQQT